MTLRRHLLSLVSVTFIGLNFIVWSIVLLLVLLPLKIAGSSRVGFAAMSWVYRKTVGTNAWWLRTVLGIDLRGVFPNIKKDASYIILSNHQSWFDIFIIQSIVPACGPIVKFLVKQELWKNPILALIFWAFDFPVLKRYTRKGENDELRRERDDNAVRTACASMRVHPTALMNFVEGTRFTAAKHAATHSSFANLLPPRGSGLRTMVAALNGSVAGIIDFTIVYNGTPSCWRCLGGFTGVWVATDVVPVPPSQGLNQWLDSFWHEKDRRIDQVRRNQVTRELP